MVNASTIKSRLRINHNSLDSQFEADIAQAKAELKRVGILSTKVEATNDQLIDKAIIAYCMWIESSSDKMAEGYKEMWNQWRDELRKSPGYGYEVSNV